MTLVTASCKTLLVCLVGMGSADDAACIAGAHEVCHVLEAIAEQKVLTLQSLPFSFVVGPPIFDSS